MIKKKPFVLTEKNYLNYVLLLLKKMEFYTNELLIVLSVLLSFLIAYISIPSIVKVSELKRLFAEPIERSVHTVRTPTLGGVAIFAGFSISVLIFSQKFHFPEFNFIIAAAIVVFFIGIKDDILIIAPWTKLGGQIVAAIIITMFGGIYISNFHGFFGIHEIPAWVGIPLSIFIILLIINSINLIDGVDGLSATICIIIFSTFGIWFYLIEDFQWTILAFSMIGACLAFLKFNLYSINNKIFMGDTGSLLMGLLVSVLAIQFNQRNIINDTVYHILPSPAVTFGILIVPVFDVFRVVFVRLILGKPIFGADKRHIHHKLLELGLSHKKIVLVMGIANLFFIGFVFSVENYITVRRLLLMIFLFAMVVFYVPTIILDFKKRQKKT